MFYSIRHITRYRYDAPVRESVMQLYVQPKSEGAQRLQSFQVSTSPRASLQAYTDHFGNAVYHFDVPGSHQELQVEADAEVETQPMPAPHEWVDASAWELLDAPQTEGRAFRHAGATRPRACDAGAERVSRSAQIWPRPPIR